MTLVLCDEAVNLIKNFEGLRLEPYKDRGATGLWTIGYGHLIRANECFGPITAQEADDLFREDIQDAEEAVKGLTKGVVLTKGQYGSLVSFTFNLGASAFRGSTLRGHVLQGNHARATQEFGRWILDEGKPLNGLIRRRAAEAEMYNS